MKTNPGKISLTASILLVALAFSACQKKTSNPAPAPATTYSSLGSFYTANAVKSQFFTINAASGGSFTTTQGTKVTIPPGALAATGNVQVEFKDIYKKSDMLLSQMPVMLGNGAPLKSAGEFFIRAMQDSNTPVNLASNGKIMVQQPANAGIDTLMKPFVFAKGAGGTGWAPANNDTLAGFVSNYVFSLYTLSAPVANGTWCNSDDAAYFAGYTQTMLNIVPDAADTTYGSDVYLIFKGLNSMVHIYQKGVQYPYAYAPEGLACTVVAVAVKNNVMYTSFTDITIAANQTVNISLTQTTAADFVAKVKSLDN